MTRISSGGYERLMTCAGTWCAGDTGQLWGACLGVACGNELNRCAL